MLTQLSATELRTKLDSREISAVDVARAHLDRIAQLNESIFAYLHTDETSVLQFAEQAQKMIDDGKAGALTGIPVALKDNIQVTGLPTTCGSKILGDFVSPFDAGVTEKMKAEGMILLGKTNLDEFAMGTSTEHSAFGPTFNPWDLTRSPGGSSGGSAAAVCAEMATLSLGSDTGGSIRQPASLCGIVGFKPTYGRCSRYGLVAFGSSLDQIGPFARNVEDAALLASVITGHDLKDATSIPMPSIDVSGLKTGSLKGKRFAVPNEVLGEGIDAELKSVFLQALKTLEAEGASVEFIDLPSIKYGVTTYYLIAPAEASSNLARFDGVRYGLREDGKGHIGMMERTRAAGFGHEVKQRIMIGTYALSAGYYDAYYLKAQQVRALMTREFNTAYETYDSVLMPTSPIPAFKIGELVNDPMALKQLDYCTIPANMGGFPAISIPCGFASGLPVGLQIMNKALDDEAVFSIAFQAERALNATKRPNLP